MVPPDRMRYETESGLATRTRTREALVVVVINSI